jgi:hypothetical protein
MKGVIATAEYSMAMHGGVLYQAPHLSTCSSMNGHITRLHLSSKGTALQRLRHLLPTC